MRPDFSTLTQIDGLIRIDTFRDIEHVDGDAVAVLFSPVDEGKSPSETAIRL